MRKRSNDKGFHQKMRSTVNGDQPLLEEDESAMEFVKIQRNALHQGGIRVPSDVVGSWRLRGGRRSPHCQAAGLEGGLS